ncbi:MAG: hypothetical protein EXS43_06090 [Opitutus sp.]|nr:hypothetical protein [Opitutus sp.]
MRASSLSPSAHSFAFAAGLLRTAALLLPLTLAAATASAADWKVFKAANDIGPGENVTVTLDGKIVARLIYGEGQQKPFVAVYDEQGRAITNAGVDKNGKTFGAEPHQRGIFIGWKVIESDLGRVDADAKGTSYKGKAADSWSMANGTTQSLVEIEKMATNDDSASIVAKIEWRHGTKDASGSNLLLTETRRVRVSRPNPAMLAQIDVAFELMPARDIRLGADVQHAGVHMRVDSSIYTRPTETSYLWSPQIPASAGKVYSAAPVAGQTGTVIGDNLKWGEFLFPLHDRWYSVTEMNAIKNPVEEFSTRNYGRFGFFFKADLKKGEALPLAYRFIVKVAETPAQGTQRSPAQITKIRKEMDNAFVRFVHEVR